MTGTFSATRARPAGLLELPDGDVLATRPVTAYAVGCHPDTIRRRVDPAACDVRTRALLYSAIAAAERLASRNDSARAA